MGDNRGGQGRVEGPSGRFETGRGTLGEVQDESLEFWVGPGRVERLSGRSDMNRGTLGKVHDGWGDPLGRFGTGQGTLKEVGERLEYPWGGP